MRALRLCTLGTLLALALAPAGALASPGDAAATRAYLQADYALNQSATAQRPGAESALKSFIKRIDTECPHAGAGSPQSLEAEAIYEEVVAVVTGIVYRSDSSGIARFARTVDRLHWSRHGVTHATHGYAARLKLLASLAMPNVCADVKTWVANNYNAVPASTKAAVRWLRRTEVGVLEVDPGLLAPYELPDETKLLDGTRRLEGRLQEIEANRGPNYLAKIVAVLGLNP